jgi:hypothetical protein
MDILVKRKVPVHVLRMKLQFYDFNLIYNSRHLTPEQQELSNGLIMFTIKDQDFLGMNEFLGEAFISFSDIPKTDMTVGLEQLEQVHLKLSRPTRQGSYE